MAGGIGTYKPANVRASSNAWLTSLASLGVTSGTLPCNRKISPFEPGRPSSLNRFNDTNALCMGRFSSELTLSLSLAPCLVCNGVGFGPSATGTSTLIRQLEATSFRTNRPTNDDLCSKNHLNNPNVVSICQWMNHGPEIFTENRVPIVDSHNHNSLKCPNGCASAAPQHIGCRTNVSLHILTSPQRFI